MNYPFWLFLTENNEEINYLFSVIGKALMICTRFERYCKHLHLLLMVKSNNCVFSFDEEYLSELADKIYEKTKLHNNIEKINNKDKTFLFDKMIEAKEIRNEIAHEITVDLSYPDFDYDNANEIINDLRIKLETVLEIEYIIVLIITKITRDVYDPPSSTYIKSNLKWVFDDS